MQISTPTTPYSLPPPSQLSIQVMFTKIQISSNAQVAMLQQHSTAQSINFRFK